MFWAETSLHFLVKTIVCPSAPPFLFCNRLKHLYISHSSFATLWLSLIDLIIIFVKYTGCPKKIVDSELFTPGDDKNTQQQDSTSGPIFIPFCDKLPPSWAISP